MKRDIYSEITAHFVGMIERAEASGDQWQLPWVKRGGMRRPTNFTTGRAYRGINVPMLWGSAQAQGFSCDEWASFKQWQAVGGQVRKGEKGTMIVFYRKLAIKDRVTGEDKEIPMVKTSYLFNVDQVDGITRPADNEDRTDATQRHADADAFIRATGADIRHGGGRAFYTPTQDFIQLPERADFIGDEIEATENYYATALHELIHWTGHDNRTGRLKPAAFGSKGYAFEELVAELGAAFLCADLGVTNAPRADHGH
jgi:antirestriction protein ArdC